MTTKALFLDRDGVININHGYVYQAENIDFINGIFDLCRHAIQLGYKIFIITNQSGIARGLYHEQDFKILVTWINAQFKQQGITITDTFFCPHHPSAGDTVLTTECDCRKPKPGMILQAKTKYDIDLTKSIFIGDKLSDMQAAEKAGVNCKILLGNNNGNNGNNGNNDTDINKGNLNKINRLNEAIQYFI